MNNLLDLPKLTQKEKEILNSLRIIILTKNKGTEINCFRGNLNQAFKEQMITISLIFFLENRKRGNIMNSCY